MIWLRFPSNSLVKCDGVGESNSDDWRESLLLLCSIGTFLFTVRSYQDGGAGSVLIKNAGSSSASGTLDQTVKMSHFFSYCYCPGLEGTGGHKLTSTSQPRPTITPLLQPWSGQQRILEKPQPGTHSSHGALSSMTIEEEATNDFAAKRTRREVCLTQESLLAAASCTKPSVSQTELQKYYTM